MLSEEEQRALFIESWDALEMFYRQTQTFGWKWISPHMLPGIRLFRAHGCDAQFYLKEIPFSQMELLRGKGPILPMHHVSLRVGFSGKRLPKMHLTFVGPGIRLTWQQTMKITPRVDAILQLMAVYPSHCPDDYE